MRTTPSWASLSKIWRARVGHRRYQDVKLTAAGRALVPKLAAIADRNDEEFFSHLSEKQRARLVATLKKLVAANKLKKIPTA